MTQYNWLKTTMASDCENKGGLVRRVNSYKTRVPPLVAPLLPKPEFINRPGGGGGGGVVGKRPLFEDGQIPSLGNINKKKRYADGPG